MRTSDAGYLSESYIFYEAILSRESDAAFLNIRLRYSLVLDPHPDSLPRIATRRSLRLQDAILSSYHHNEVKFSELTLHTFRMLQCLEWEPSGSFYQSNSTKIGQNGGPGPSRINYNQDITDPTLPANSRKVELLADGVLLIYLSASELDKLSSPLGAGTSINTAENVVRNFQSHNVDLDGASTSPFSSPSNCQNQSSRRSKGDCLYFGARGNGGLNSIYPTDLVPFMRRPLFIVIDSDVSDTFKAVNGAEKGEPAAIAISPRCSISLNAAESSRHQSGSLFTLFLTTPLRAFCLLIGLSGSDIEMDTYNMAEKLLSSSLNDWGSTLANLDALDPVWAQILGDPFLRRLLLRFIFCRAVLTLYASSFGRKEWIPECMPHLPASLLPTAIASQTVVLQMANIFSATKKFIFSEGTVLPEYIHSDVLMASAS
ncbi:hypothetical protein P3X46_008140 [Hevea brasiliensis]|uniref:Protein SCAI n=1 Tax=Hevea brasiliensis TaxID=3981 RepID=A0ABQ9MHL1_HEVBR|nr:hypothetical protein P3X46_008140 [Hevea brasiliensis]